MSRSIHRLLSSSAALAVLLAFGVLATGCAGTPAAISALNLSLLVVAIVVPLNVVFGIPTALVLARNKFRGKGVLQAVIDLPFAVSPVVVGVALILHWIFAKVFTKKADLPPRS